MAIQLSGFEFRGEASIGGAPADGYKSERQRLARTLLKNARTLRLLPCPYKDPLRVAHSVIKDAGVNYLAAPSADPLRLQPDFRWDQIVGL